MGDHSLSIKLPPGFEQADNILALGGELKNTLCSIHHGTAVITASMGDLEQEAVYRHFNEQVTTLFQQDSPQHLVIDKHPDYLSSQKGETLASIHGSKLTSIQHHHAHIAAVMVDNGLALDSAPLLGIALDGLGFGDDGTIWGGEILLADYHHSQRVACFAPVAMIGGAAAIQQPWRNTLAHLLPIWDQVQQGFAHTDIIQFLNSKPITLMQSMVDQAMNAPLASSCGRLFDAVAASLHVHRERITFEAQAAIALEELATSCFESETKPYSYGIDAGTLLQLNWQKMWLELLTDIQQGTPAASIASRFHHTLIHALCGLAVQLREEYSVDSVALSGGVFQNRLISLHLSEQLRSKGFTVCQHRQVATHDAGLSLGQAVLAAAR